MNKKMQAEFDAKVAERVQEILSDRGRRAGLAGGPARAAALSPRRRRQIARKAAQARWNKRKNAA
jgi:hypothetical protein